MATIVRENRRGRTVRLVDPVRTHTCRHNELKRAYIYALMDSHGVMRVIGSKALMTGVTNTFPPGHTRATVGSGHNSVTVNKTSLFSLSLPAHAYR